MISKPILDFLLNLIMLGNQKTYKKSYMPVVFTHYWNDIYKMFVPSYLGLKLAYKNTKISNRNSQ